MESRNHPDQQDLHSQTDSFLTAARLLRGSRLDGGQHRRWQFAHEDSPVASPTANCPGARAPVEPSTEDSEVRTPSEGGEPGSERNTDGDVPVGSLTFIRGRTGVVYAWPSGCRVTYRKSRRLRAPLLPAIAEI